MPQVPLQPGKMGEVTITTKTKKNCPIVYVGTALGRRLGGETIHASGRGDSPTAARRATAVRFEMKNHDTATSSAPCTARAGETTGVLLHDIFLRSRAGHAHCRGDRRTHRRDHGPARGCVSPRPRPVGRAARHRRAAPGRYVRQAVGKTVSSSRAVSVSEDIMGGLLLAVAETRRLWGSMPLLADGLVPVFRSSGGGWTSVQTVNA